MMALACTNKVLQGCPPSIMALSCIPVVLQGCSVHTHTHTQLLVRTHTRMHIRTHAPVYMVCPWDSSGESTDND